MSHHAHCSVVPCMVDVLEPRLLLSSAPLLIDFGQTGSPTTHSTMSSQYQQGVSITTPAHESGGLANSYNVYNNVGTSNVGSGMVYGDGSTATGVSLTWGRSTTDGGPINFSDSSGLTLINVAANTALKEYDNAIYADTIKGGSYAENAVKISGLEAGTYKVYFTGNQSNQADDYRTLMIGANLTNYVAAESTFHGSQTHDGQFTIYGDFVMQEVTLAAGDDLVVISHGHYGERQYFNALEIVAVADAPNDVEFMDTQQGVYRGAAPGGPDKVNAYCEWLGQEDIWGEEFTGDESWYAISEPYWLMNEWRDWKAEQPGRKLILSVPMLPTISGVSLTTGATGAYNGWFETLAEKLVERNLGDSIIRLGWEMNGGWYAWAANGQLSQFIDYWREIVDTMRDVPGTENMQFCWNPTLGWGQYPTEQAYPGDDWVDLIGVDAYDQSWETDTYPWPTDATDSDIQLRREKVVYSKINGTYDLRWWASFAKQHNKELTIPEWGIWDRTDGHGGKDNPLFIQMMHAFIADPANNVTMHTYFDYSSGVAQHQLSPRSDGTYQFPNSSAMFYRLYNGHEAAGQTITLSASDDAYIRGGTYADTNYGSSTSLAVKEDTGETYDRRSYLKFDLSSLPSSINSAELTLPIASVGTDVANMSIEVQLVTNDSWNESTLTWNNSPAGSTVLATIAGTDLLGDSVSIDLTSAVETQLAGDGVLSLRLIAVNAAGSQRLVYFGSAEQADPAMQPQLIVTTQDTAPTGGLAAIDDSYVQGGTYADTNFSSAVSLMVKNDTSETYDRISYLKFDLSGVSASLSSANLVLPIASTGTDVANMSIEVQLVTSDSWSESSLTWNNRPTGSTVLATIAGADLLNDYVTVDITAAAEAQRTGDGLLSIRLVAVNAVGSQRLVTFGAAEHTNPALQPQLIIETDAPTAIVATADATIRGGTYGDTNYGSDTTLMVKEDNGSDYDRAAFLQFDLTSLSSSVNSALLVLPIISTGTDVANMIIEVQLVTNDSWDESTLTWNNQPTSSTVLATISGSDLLGDSVSIDLTSAVNTELAGDGVLSIRLVAVNDPYSQRLVSFGSSEQTDPSLQPQLIIT